MKNNNKEEILRKMARDAEPKTPEEFKQCNDRFIQTVKAGKYTRDLFLDNLIEDYEQRIKSYTEKYEYPGPYIKEYLSEQITAYQDRIKNYGLNLIEEINISEKKIDLDYLRARAWPQYVEYLKRKLNETEYIRPVKKKSECKAPAVARAFYMYELLNRPKYNNVSQSDKTTIIRIAEKEFPDIKGNTTHSILAYNRKQRKGISKGMFFAFDSFKEAYPDEYKYADKLFKEKHPEL